MREFRKKISILIVNYHTEKYIIEFLKDFSKQTLPIQNYEVIIVNNCQTDVLHKAIEQLQSTQKIDIKIVASDINLGFGRAMNLAASHAEGEHFLIANPDLRMMQNDYLEKLLEKTQIYSDYGIITTKLLNDLDKDKAEIYNYDLGLVIEGDNDKIRWFRGALLLLKNEVFKQLNGFDGDFFMYCEDEDLCIRAKKNNLKFIKIDDLKIHHIGGVSEGVRNLSFYMMWYKSMLLLNYKHLSLEAFQDKLIKLRKTAKRQVSFYKFFSFTKRPYLQYKVLKWQAMLMVCDKTIKETPDWLYFKI